MFLEVAGRCAGICRKGAMNSKKVNIELVDSDFGCYSPDDVKCRGCNGPLCGDKTPKMYRGKILFVCHLGEAGSTVLANAAARIKEDAGK